MAITEINKFKKITLTSPIQISGYANSNVYYGPYQCIKTDPSTYYFEVERKVGFTKITERYPTKGVYASKKEYAIGLALAQTKDITRFGLTVGIIDDDGKLIEYTFKDGVADSDLVEKPISFEDIPNKVNITDFNDVDGKKFVPFRKDEIMSGGRIMSDLLDKSIPTEESLELPNVKETLAKIKDNFTETEGNLKIDYKTIVGKPEPITSITQLRLSETGDFITPENLSSALKVPSRITDLKDAEGKDITSTTFIKPAEIDSKLNDFRGTLSITDLKDAEGSKITATTFAKPSDITTATKDFALRTELPDVDSKLTDFRSTLKITDIKDAEGNIITSRTFAKPGDITEATKDFAVKTDIPDVESKLNAFKSGLKITDLKQFDGSEITSTTFAKPLDIANATKDLALKTELPDVESKLSAFKSGLKITDLKLEDGSAITTGTFARPTDITNATKDFVTGKQVSNKITSELKTSGVLNEDGSKKVFVESGNIDSLVSQSIAKDGTIRSTAAAAVETALNDSSKMTAIVDGVVAGKNFAVKSEIPTTDDIKTTIFGDTTSTFQSKFEALKGGIKITDLKLDDGSAITSGTFATTDALTNATKNLLNEEQVANKFNSMKGDIKITDIKAADGSAITSSTFATTDALTNATKNLLNEEQVASKFNTLKSSIKITELKNEDGSAITSTTFAKPGDITEATKDFITDAQMSTKITSELKTSGVLNPDGSKKTFVESGNIDSLVSQSIAKDGTIRSTAAAAVETALNDSSKMTAIVDGVVATKNFAVKSEVPTTDDIKTTIFGDTTSTFQSKFDALKGGIKITELKNEDGSAITNDTFAKPDDIAKATQDMALKTDIPDVQAILSNRTVSNNKTSGAETDEDENSVRTAKQKVEDAIIDARIAAADVLDALNDTKTGYFYFVMNSSSIADIVTKNNALKSGNVTKDTDEDYNYVFLLAPKTKTVIDTYKGGIDKYLNSLTAPVYSGYQNNTIIDTIAADLESNASVASKNEFLNMVNNIEEEVNIITNGDDAPILNNKSLFNKFALNYTTFASKVSGSISGIKPVELTNIYLDDDESMFYKSIGTFLESYRQENNLSEIFIPIFYTFIQYINHNIDIDNDLGTILSEISIKTQIFKKVVYSKAGVSEDLNVVLKLCDILSEYDYDKLKSISSSESTQYLEQLVEKHGYDGEEFIKTSSKGVEAMIAYSKTLKFETVQLLVSSTFKDLPTKMVESLRASYTNASFKTNATRIDGFVTSTETPVEFNTTVNAIAQYVVVGGEVKELPYKFSANSVSILNEWVNSQYAVSNQYERDYDESKLLYFGTPEQVVTLLSSYTYEILDGVFTESTNGDLVANILTRETAISIINGKSTSNKTNKIFLVLTGDNGWKYTFDQYVWLSSRGVKTLKDPYTIKYSDPRFVAIANGRPLVIAGREVQLARSTDLTAIRNEANSTKTSNDTNLEAMAQLVNSLIGDLHVIARNTVSSTSQSSIAAQLKTFDFSTTGNKATFNYDSTTGKYQSRAISQTNRVNNSISMNDSINTDSAPVMSPNVDK